MLDFANANVLSVFQKFAIAIFPKS
ncbi:hypothetical protein BRAO285_1300085 [Bradyrhizobium sp. ORS 285]|nr:hypothetical protein BRAO285_1300085 [Bradyrhizobium sp. ORS 285]